MKGVLRSIVEVVFSATLLFVVLSLLFVGFDNSSTRRSGHLWARGLRLEQEDVCPQAFGNDFWFACASQARAQAQTPSGDQSARNELKSRQDP